MIRAWKTKIYRLGRPPGPGLGDIVMGSGHDYYVCVGENNIQHTGPSASLNSLNGIFQPVTKGYINVHTQGQHRATAHSDNSKQVLSSP